MATSLCWRTHSGQTNIFSRCKGSQAVSRNKVGSVFWDSLYMYFFILNFLYLCHSHDLVTLCLNHQGYPSCMCYEHAYFILAYIFRLKWFFLKWLFLLLSVKYAFSQTLQGNCLRPLWKNWWFTKFFLIEKPFLQISHTNLFAFVWTLCLCKANLDFLTSLEQSGHLTVSFLSSVWQCILSKCTFLLLSVKNALSQTLQGNCRRPLWKSWWVAKFFLIEKPLLQISHTNLFSFVWTLRLWADNPDFLTSLLQSGHLMDSFLSSSWPCFLSKCSFRSWVIDVL